MTQARFASALALAAFLAVPAFAQTDSNSSTVNGATVAPLEKNAAKQSASSSKQAKADSTTSSTTAKAADCNSKMVDGANVAPLEKNAAKQQATADGKLRDKMATSTDCMSDKPVASKKVKKSTKTASK